jgi:Leucine-rich repeat (LRR) protein
MLSNTFILNITKYTSHKTNKISILCLKKKEIPMIKYKEIIYECEKGEFLKYNNNLYKITKKMYLCIVNKNINNNRINIYNINKLASTIKYMIDLKELLLNNLTKIPNSIGKLTNLQFLVINNKLKEIPKSIGKLTNLQKLSLENNNLTEIPKSIIKLTNLKTLSMYNNNLTKIPKSIYKLTNLQSLILTNNNLTKIPKSIGKFSKLTYLSLENNNLTNIPKSIGKLTDLQYLILTNNNLTNIPKSIENLKNHCVIYYK